MFPLDLRHCEEAIHILQPAAPKRIPRRIFIFPDVAAFQLSSAVHWNQPPADMTDKANRAGDNSRSYLSSRIRFGTDCREDLADQLPVMPLLLLDTLDALSFLGCRDRVPMATIGIARSLLS